MLVEAFLRRKFCKCSHLPRYPHRLTSSTRLVRTLPFDAVVRASTTVNCQRVHPLHHSRKPSSLFQQSHLDQKFSFPNLVHLPMRLKSLIPESQGTISKWRLVHILWGTMRWQLSYKLDFGHLCVRLWVKTGKSRGLSRCLAKLLPSSSLRFLTSICKSSMESTASPGIEVMTI